MPAKLSIWRKSPKTKSTLHYLVFRHEPYSVGPGNIVWIRVKNLSLGRYLFSVVHGKRYLPKGSKEKLFFLLLLLEISCQIGNTVSNHIVTVLLNESKASLFF